MAVAQIPSMPTMPDIAGGYAKIGEQIAGVGKQIGGMVVDFASAQGKKKLVDEIKVKYPSVVQAYPEDVLMQMDNKELGTRLAAVVGIENAIPRLKEIDPKFSTADIEQMKAEIFKQPDQARTIAKDWMAIAEKNRQDEVNKKFMELPTTEGGQPAMPQVAPQSTPAPISDADLNGETSSLLDPTKAVMPSQTSQSDLGQQLAAVDAERTPAPVMPAVPGRQMTKEEFYSKNTGSFSRPPSADTQTMKDKGMQSQKDIDAENARKQRTEIDRAYKKAKLDFAKQKENADAAGKKEDRILKIKEYEDKVKKEADYFEKILLDKQADVTASDGKYPYDVEALKELVSEKRSQADYWKNVAQGAAKGGKSATGSVRDIDVETAAIEAWNKEAKKRGQPLFEQIEAGKKDAALKQIVARYKQTLK